MSAQFHDLVIDAVKCETADAISVIFRMPGAARDAFAFQPGQHLTLRAEIDGEDVRRNYSLCVAPDEGQLKVAIKRIAGGRFSNWAAENLKPGITLQVMPPHGIFTIDFSPERAAHYVGIAGGSGITPVLSLLKAALAQEPRSRFTLIYGNRDCNSMMFLEELWALKNRHMNRLSLINILSDELDDVELFNGFLNREKCDAILGTLYDLADVRAFFICGPGPMMDAAEMVLHGKGITADRILIERFTTDRPSAGEAAAIAAQSEAAAGTPMRITLDGRTRIVRFGGNSGNILQSAHMSGMPAPYACRAGVCATCRAKVVIGQVTMAARYGLSDDEIAAGYILTCQALPASEELVIDFDQ